MGERLNKTKKWAWVLVGFVVVIALIVWKSTRAGHAVDNPEGLVRPLSVQTMTVESEPIPEEVWASGTVVPYAQAKLAPRIMSTVSAVYVREGDHVTAGQVLIRLEARDLAAQVASAGAAVQSARSMMLKAGTAAELQAAQTRANIANAEAALQVAQQQLSVVKEGPRRQEKAQAQLAVVQAEAVYKNAESEVNRMTRLYDQGVVPKQRLEGAQTAFVVAKAQLGVARQQAEMSDEGSRSQDIQSAQERVRQAEEALRLARAAAVQNKMAKREAQASAAMVTEAKAGESSAKVMLGYATIVAPISGVVTARYVDPGDTVSPGVPALVVEDDSVYRLEASVPARNVGEITKGMTVGLEIGSNKRIGNGRVAEVTPAGDPSSRKFTVKVDIPKSLRPVSGDFGRIAFAVGYSDGILVPESALHDDGGIINVYVVGPNGHTDMRIVRVGRKTSRGTEIVTGLSVGDKVITSASGRLSDDVPVEYEGGSQ